MYSFYEDGTDRMFRNVST